MAEFYLYGAACRLVGLYSACVRFVSRRQTLARFVVDPHSRPMDLTHIWCAASGTGVSDYGFNTMLLLGIIYSFTRGLLKFGNRRFE